MKIITRKYYLILLFILFYQTITISQSFWTFTNGPINSNIGVTAFAETSDNTIICADGQGIFKYNAISNNWDTLAFNLSIDDLKHGVNGEIYATGQSGLLKAKSDGNVWNRLSYLPQHYGDHLAISYANTIFVESNTYFYKTTDEGKNWSLVRFDDGSFSVGAIECDMNNHILYVAKGGYGVYSLLKSNDEGSTWINCVSIPEKTITNIQVNEIGELFISTYKGLYYSDDFGNSFKKILDGHIIKGVAFGSNNVVIALLLNNYSQPILASNDFGNHWIPLPVPLSPNIQTLIVSNNNFIFCGLYNGYVYKSNFLINDFTSQVKGIDVSDKNGIITNLQWLNIANYGIKFAYLKATESSNAYAAQSNFKNNKQNAINNNIVVGAYHFATPLFSPKYYQPVYDHQNSVDDEVLNFLKVASSTIGNNFLPPVLDVEEQVVAWKLTPNGHYLATIYVDPLSGLSHDNSDPPNPLPSQPAMESYDLAQWIIEWVNKVEQQTKVTPILYCNKTYAQALYPYIGDKLKLWIAAHSDPMGNPDVTGYENWNWLFHQYSKSGAIAGISPVDLDIFNGNIMTLISLTHNLTEVEETNKIHATFELDQNYPNPFNPSTTIRFSIPAVETRHASSLHVLLKVYDLLGREVATLVNEEKAQGNYEVKFDGSSLPSGVYFYRLQAGSFSQTRKLVLVK